MCRDEDDLERSTKIMYESFLLLNNVFKAYCTKGDVSQCLTLNTFTEFCLDCEIIDHDQCSLNAVDTIFIQANIVKKEPTLAEKNFKQVLIKNNKHLMQRYQFLISLVRIAFAKNGGQGRQRGALCDALYLLIDVNISMEAQRIESDIYRRRRVYRQEIDAVIFQHTNNIKSIYKSYR
tara:strand:+ start:537 stop:1070 length:534 start_codon:yes stop_codon:yes gene_type:complete